MVNKNFGQRAKERKAFNKLKRVRGVSSRRNRNKTRFLTIWRAFFKYSWIEAIVVSVGL